MVVDVLDEFGQRVHSAFQQICDVRKFGPVVGSFVFVCAVIDVRAGGQGQAPAE